MCDTGHVGRGNRRQPQQKNPSALIFPYNRTLQQRYLCERLIFYYTNYYFQPEEQWGDNVMNNLLKESHFIGGQWIASENTYPVFNPATEEVRARVAFAGAAEAAQALTAAEQALPAWKKLPAAQRSEILYRWYQLMLDNSEALAVLMSEEQGKCLQEARGEVRYAASFLQWFAEEAKRVYGDIIPSVQVDTRICVVKQPIGVVAAITPWNFPLAMITRKAGAALAAGCTLLVKPSEETPQCALALAVLAQQAGVPDGVLNMISGDARAIGEVWLSSSQVRKISFTGSTAVGKMLMQKSAPTLKKCSLELGGNAPFIVFDDADIDAAVEGAVAAKFRNAGQTCVCVNRFFVHDTVYEAFTSRLAEAVSRLRVGNGLDSHTEIGPLINADAVAKVSAHVTDALAQGAVLRCGGKALGGNFFAPTVLSEMQDSMLIAQEETFGPIAACFRFHHDDEVIARANNTLSGLAGYAYTQNMKRIWRLVDELEVGMLGINRGIISTEVAPFGGVKESGQGREGSKYGLEDYLETKYVLLGM